MRILFDNALERATLTSVSGSLNYPVTNIIDSFLEARYQPFGTLTDTITGEWDSDEDLSCIFIAYHTLSAVTVRLKDSGGTTLYTFTESSPIDVFYKDFGSVVSGIRSIEIDVTFASTPSYLGGVGVGGCFKMPDFLSDYELPLQDNSTFTTSPGGQTNQNPGTILRVHPFGFRDLKQETKDNFINEYYSIGRGKNIYILPFEGSDVLKPFYGIFIDPPETVKDGRRFDYTFTLRESR